jgi:hypothetical protein
VSPTAELESLVGGKGHESIGSSVRLTAVARGRTPSRSKALKSTVGLPAQRHESNEHRKVSRLAEREKL